MGHEDRKRRPYDPSRKNGSPPQAHPVKGFYNYIVGQLAMNPNFFMSDVDSDLLTDETIKKDVDKIMRVATALCDGTHERNKQRFENNKDQ